MTGYDKYAVNAFELCALDYIMKPVQLKRLEKTVERLRRLWPKLAKKMNHFYQEKGMLAEAIQVNKRIQLLHPLDEECYFCLMQLYDAMNDSASVEEQYELLATRWEQELDSAVNADISNWYQAWKEKQYA